MGNAHLTAFKVTADIENLKQAMRAYTQAERDATQQRNPDLHFNLGTIHQYHEDYDLALQRFARAAELDPTLPAQAQCELIVAHTRRIAEAIGAHGGMKARKLSALLKQLPAKDERGKWVRVLKLLSSEKDIPQYVFVCYVTLSGTDMLIVVGLSLSGRL